MAGTSNPPWTSGIGLLSDLNLGNVCASTVMTEYREQPAQIVRQ